MVHVDYTQQLPQDGMVTNLPVYEKAGASVCVCVCVCRGKGSCLPRYVDSVPGASFQVPLPLSSRGCHREQTS